MPTIPTPPVPDWADPQSESVFEPLTATLLRRLGGLVGADDPTDPGIMSPTPLVAAVPPTQIPALKQRGKDLLEKVLREGLEAREGAFPLRFPDLLPNNGNVPLTPELVEALTFAQQKYPRIFGHLDDIAQVDIKNMAPDQLGRHTYGSLGAGFRVRSENGQPVLDLQKTGRLGLNPPAIRDKGKEAARTVGHELLHLADNITQGPEKFNASYDRSNLLPEGYSGNSFEKRAIVQGERFLNKLKGIPNPKPQSLGVIEDELLQREKEHLIRVQQDPIKWLQSKFKDITGF